MEGDFVAGVKANREHPVPKAHALFDLSGRIALVTGSSRGIGLGIARGLAEVGATVVMNGRDGAKLEAARAALAADGLGVVACAFDATDRAQVALAVEAIENDTGPIDILVNNAGIQRRGAFADFPEAMARLGGRIALAGG